MKNLKIGCIQFIHDGKNIMKLFQNFNLIKQQLYLNLRSTLIIVFLSFIFGFTYISFFNKQIFLYKIQIKYSPIDYNYFVHHLSTSTYGIIHLKPEFNRIDDTFVINIFINELQNLDNILENFYNSLDKNLTNNYQDYYIKKIEKQNLFLSYLLPEYLNTNNEFKNFYEYIEVKIKNNPNKFYNFDNSDEIYSFTKLQNKIEKNNKLNDISNYKILDKKRVTDSKVLIFFKFFILLYSIFYIINLIKSFYRNTKTKNK